MAAFLASLAHDDLAPATLRGYRYDLRHFVAWHRTVHDGPFALGDLTGHELTAYRQHMVAGGFRPATVNRRLDALRAQVGDDPVDWMPRLLKIDMAEAFA